MTYHVQVWYRDGRQFCLTCTDVEFSGEVREDGKPEHVEVFLFRKVIKGYTTGTRLKPGRVREVVVHGPTGEFLTKLEWDDAVNTCEEQQEQHRVAGPEDLPRQEE